MAESRAYTKVPNRLLEAILAAGFSGTQVKILLAIVRMTYGWNRSDVTISAPELAERCGLSSKGSFRRELRDLITNAVIRVLDPGGGITPPTLAVEPDPEKWRAFHVGTERLEARWDRRDAKLARSDEPNPRRSGKRPSQSNPIGSGHGMTSEGQPDPQRSGGMTVNGQGVWPITVIPKGSKCDGVVNLDPPKERKERKERTTSPNGEGAHAAHMEPDSAAVKVDHPPPDQPAVPPEKAPNVEPRGGWPGEVARWLAARGISAKPGHIGGALKPAVERWGLPRVLDGLACFFDDGTPVFDVKPEFVTFATFAKNPGLWIERAMPFDQLSLEERARLGGAPAAHGVTPR